MTNETKICPYCAEEIRQAATKCRYCQSTLDRQITPGEWYRDVEAQKLTGVCAGLARQFQIAATPIRIAFVVAALFGWGLVIYLALWILMPVRTSAGSAVAPSPPAP